MAKQRSYKVDFYCVEHQEVSTHSLLSDFLEQHLNGHAPAHTLPGDPDVKYQIRSIKKNATGKIYRGVFGKLRHDGTPEQATEDGEESDVELKPGHGLVEKIIFYFTKISIF